MAPPACSSDSTSISASPALRIQVAGRLVGQQDRRLAGDGAGDRHELLMAARQLPGPLLGRGGHADPFERGVDPARRARAGVAPRSVSGYSTFSYTLMSPIRLKL